MAEQIDENELTDRFAREVKAARERAGISQATLAEAVGASLDHLGKLERAKYLPGLLVAGRLMKQLGIDANALLQVSPRKRAASRHRLDREAALASIAESLDDQTLDTAIELLGVLASRQKRARGKSG